MKPKITMKYIQFDLKTISLSVANELQPGGVNLEVRETDIAKENPFAARLPIATRVYKEVIYAEQEAEDKRLGRKVEHLLAPPDPWLVGIAMVMWEGIVQGIAWDGVKGLVSKALGTLREHGMAPESADIQITKRQQIELGFCWKQYVGDKKLFDMFLGLRRSYELEQKQKAKPTKASHKRIKRK
jgi:hypothetical protein